MLNCKDYTTIAAVTTSDPLTSHGLCHVFRTLVSLRRLSFAIGRIESFCHFTRWPLIGTEGYADFCTVNLYWNYTRSVQRAKLPVDFSSLS